MSAEPSPDAAVDELATRIAEVLGASRVSPTVAVAESLTGGSLAARLAAAPDSSEWFRGGIVAYSSEVKHDLLEVPPGPVVSATSATAMAVTTRRLLGATFAVAVTGVGGPDPQDGEAPGTVYAALVSGDEVSTQRWDLDGEPDEIVHRTCERALRWLVEACER